MRNYLTKQKSLGFINHFLNWKLRKILKEDSEHIHEEKITPK